MVYFKDILQTAQHPSRELKQLQSAIQLYKIKSLSLPTSSSDFFENPEEIRQFYLHTPRHKLKRIARLVR